MKSKWSLVIVTSCYAAASAVAAPMGAAFTYQGQLKQGGSPFTGTVGMDFSLWDAATVGNQVGATQTVNNVQVNSGLFSVQLNDAAQFGSNVFNGNARWLQIVVNGSPLSPRQAINASPAALFAAGPWALDGSSLNYTGGNVGIGTNTPATQLHVKPSAYGAGSGTGLFVGGNPYEGGFTGLAIDLSQQSGGYATLQAIASSGSAYGAIVLNPIEGGVGIGTAAPSARFEVNDTGFPTQKLISTSDLGTWLELSNTSAGGHSWNLISSGSSNSEEAGKLLFNDQTAGDTRMVIDSSGNVGINKDDPVAKLDVVNTAGAAVQGTGINGVLGTASSGPNHYGIHGIGNLLGQKAGYFEGNVQVDGSVCASGTIGTGSDARFKKNVENVTDALPLVEKLRPVRFDWKREEFPSRRFSKDRQLGLIAQEVQRVVPDVVQKNDDGYLSVDYGRLTPLLVQAIKEQQKQLEASNHQVAAQQKQINELQARLERQESRLDQNIRLAEGR